MQTIQRGNAAEAAVLAAFVAAEIPILLPFGDGLSFDLAALMPPDGQVLRIQVKSGRIRNGCVMFKTCSTDHGSGQLPYTGRADLIAVHVPDPEGVFVVPVDQCPMSACVLRIEDTRNNQRRRVRFAKDHTLEAWLGRLAPDLREAAADAPRPCARLGSSGNSDPP